MSSPSSSVMPSPAAGVIDNVTEYSVGSLSRALKQAVESGFGRVRVRGEISGLRRPASGHIYFDLKDEEAVLATVCWKGIKRTHQECLEDGLELFVTGRLSTYGAQSKYQLIVEDFEPAGEGALLKLLEERKRRLAAQGLFDPDKKKPLPFLPEVIGIVTSPTGAVIRDILHRLADRFPRRVLVWPSAVQGAGAAQQIAAAIAGFNALPVGGAVGRPDLIIVARGGGSLEDMMAFNDEAVVRAAAASVVPLIAAIGHETDTTLIDHAADRRVPTPSAAAEIAVPVRAELHRRLIEQGQRLVNALDKRRKNEALRLSVFDQALSQSRHRLDRVGETIGLYGQRLSQAVAASMGHKNSACESLGAGLRYGNPQAALMRRRTRIDEWTRQMVASVRARMKTYHRDVRTCADLLESYSYRNVLARGYSVVRDQGGRPVTRAAQTRPDMAITIEFVDAPPLPARLGAASGGDQGRHAPERNKEQRDKQDDQGYLL